jgi:CheY-like chemotaxis protein
MAATAAETVTPRRVLVVEDDPTICELLGDLLGAEGFETVCVATDREAYSVLPTVPPFVALLVDVNLGAGTTGFDVARFARQVFPDLPVVYVTGQASPESFNAFGVPGSVLVMKPFTADELRAAMRQTLPADD